MAIIAPAIGTVYLIRQIDNRDLRGWQHYACFTSLIFLISVMFLVASGKVESFGVAGNSVRVVDQKLQEIKDLTEQNKLMAQKTVELITSLASTPLTADKTRLGNLNELRPRAIELLKASGLSDSEVQKFFNELNKKFSPTNSP
ncbi:MAG TPA: hypothetical protein VN887_13750 [Candidatus Angelobacter sp.]|nr:hypothetical protein [Candidatus Angelobacter sp.]